MNPERLFSIIALLLAIGAFATGASAVRQYSDLSDAASWPEVSGTVVRVTHVHAPGVITFGGRSDYVEIEYRFKDSAGMEARGVSLAPERYQPKTGEMLAIRADPDHPGTSYPEEWRAEHASEQGMVALVGVLAGLAMLWVARYLWWQGSGAQPCMNSGDRSGRR